VGASKLANTTVRLFRRTKTDSGWGHYPAVISANGRVKPGWVTIAGDVVDVTDTDGYYELRYYRGSQMIYERLDHGASQAWNACKRKEQELSARVAARDAGLEIVEIPGRLNLRKELLRFVQAAIDRDAKVAARVYESSADEFLTIIGRTYADEITPEDLLKYQRELRRSVADRTISNRHANVRAFLRWCELDVKALSPILPKYEKTIPQAYSTEEMRNLFASIHDAKLRNTYDILLQCGLREQEAVFLPWSNIKLDTGVLQVRSQPAYGFKIKDKEQRDLVIPADLLGRLREYREQHLSEKLVTGTRTDRPNQKLLRTLKRLVQAAGLNCGYCDSCKEHDECENWFLHKFRATAITNWHRSGLDTRSIMRLSGHSDMETLMKYLAPLGNDAIRERVNNIKWR